MSDMVDEVYETILEDLHCATLFGERIDISNPKHVAVAFYYKAQQEELQRKMEESDHLMRLFFANAKQRRRLANWLDQGGE